MELTREEAARVALHFQQLGRDRPKASHSSTLEVVRSLGNLQIDTINVVERSHHLVLYSRLEGYRSGILDDLLFKKRKLCEYFTNVAAIIPIEDYPYYFYGWITRRSSWIQKFWLPKNEEYVEEVHKGAPKNRAFTTDDFTGSLQRSGRGWSGSELTRALNILLLRGDLVIHHREGARRFYARRKTSQSIKGINDRKLLRFIIQRALNVMGIGTLREIQLARLMSATDYKGEVQSMVKEGMLDATKVKGLGGDHYILNSRKEEIEGAVEATPPDHATLLSPFDNLVINRQRTFKLFGFYPRFEAYVPKEKRNYGYYNMPILHQEKLLGYVDPKLDRKTSVMTFQTLNLDHGPDEKALSALVEEFARFLRFHEAERLEVKTSQPHTIAKKIQNEVARALRHS